MLSTNKSNLNIFRIEGKLLNLAASAIVHLFVVYLIY